jgi:hypothetical protein
MQQAVIANVLHQKETKKLGDREEEVRGKGVPLAKAIPTSDPPRTPFSKTTVFPVERMATIHPL